MLQTPFSRFSKSVDSPQFSPHVPRRENSRASSVSCSRVLSSRESRSSGRGSRKDKRARSRGGGSRGLRRRSRSRSSCRSRSSGRERGRRSSSASRSSRGRSRCERSRSSDRYRSRRGSSRSRRDRSRSSDQYRSRRERSRSFDRYRSRRERARSPARRGERRGRSQSHALPNRSRDRSRSSVRLPASPARLWTVEAGRLARRGPQEGVEAFASQPPVAWCSGGRPSCCRRGVHYRSPVCFAGACQVLHELVWLLFPGSNWRLGGCDRFCSGVGGVSRAPLRLLLERPLFVLRL